MSESTKHRQKSLPKQQIPPERSIPSNFISNKDKYKGFHAILIAAFAEQIRLNTSKSPHIEANSVGEKSGALLTPAHLPSSYRGINNSSTSGVNEHVGYLILPRREEVYKCKPNVYRKNNSFDSTDPTSEDSSISSYTIEYNGTYLETQATFQPIMLSHLDGPFDTRSPSVAARVSPFVAENDQFGLDSTRPPCNIDVPEPHEGSTIDRQGTGGDKSNHTLHSVQYYLKFTDDFRETLKKGVPMYDVELDLLSSVLEGILAHEATGDTPMQFSTIIFTRFEKLLKTLVDHSGRGQHSARPSFSNAIHLAATIQRRWQIRFRDKLFSLEDERTRYMVRYGLLADVAVEPSHKGDGTAQWVAQKQRQGAGTDLINFHLGQWWLNTACALRDGVANLRGDKKVGSQQLVTFLILLRGVEIHNPESGCMVYEFEGKLEHIFIHLHDKVGKRIRLIRGYKLKSKNAPKIGIRYDGIHMLRRYGLKLLDTTKQLYRSVLHFEAVKGESGFDEDLFKPSLKDDWELYKKVEKAEMKRFCSKSGYNAWQTEEEHEAKDIQEWHRRERFREQAKNLNF